MSRIPPILFNELGRIQSGCALFLGFGKCCLYATFSSWHIAPYRSDKSPAGFHKLAGIIISNSSFASSGVKGVKEVIAPYGR